MPAKSLSKAAIARWRTPQNLATLARKMPTAVPNPAELAAGDLKVMLGHVLRGRPLHGDPALLSAARLPGAGRTMPMVEAVRQLRKMQPSLLRRILEGSGVAAERVYPGFRAQLVPFTGKAAPSLYNQTTGDSAAPIMHIAPRVGGAEKYFRQAGGALPGRAFIGAFDVQPGTKWYGHGGARMAYSGLGGKPMTRHALDAFEAIVPPAMPRLGFFGVQRPGGQALDVTGVAPDKIRKWFESYTAGTGGIVKDLLGGAVKTSASSESPLDILRAAKAESDRRNYAAKHALLRRILRERLAEFTVDSDKDGVLGLTHKTRFRIHLPKKAWPGELPLLLAKAS